MSDQNMNDESRVERKRQRDAAQKATDDGMPIAPEKHDARDTKPRQETDAEDIPHRTPRQRVRHARKWISAEFNLML